jgi:hypothetical protein
MKFNKPRVRIKSIGRGAKEWVKNNWKMHAVDSTALAFASNPIFGALEVNAGKIFQHVPFFKDHTMDMSDDVSAYTRLTGTALAYAGLGLLISRGRDLSRKLTGIVVTTKEKTKAIHDSLYLGGLNIFIAPGMYSASQALAGEEIKSATLIAGTSIAVGFGLTCGPIMGYAVDALRDFTGVEENDRVPSSFSNLEASVRNIEKGKMGFCVPFSNYICEKLDGVSNYFKNATLSTKRKFAAASVGGLLAATCGVYALTEDKFGQEDDQTQTVQVEESRVADSYLTRILNI